MKTRLVSDLKVGTLFEIKHAAIGLFVVLSKGDDVMCYWLPFRASIKPTICPVDKAAVVRVLNE